MKIVAKSVTTLLIAGRGSRALSTHSSKDVGRINSQFEQCFRDQKGFVIYVVPNHRGCKDTILVS